MDWAPEAMECVDCKDFASFYWGLCRLRDGGVAEAKNGILEVFILDIHSRAIVGSRKVGWVVDLPRDHFLYPYFLKFSESDLQCVNAIQASLNDSLKGGGERLVYSMWTSLDLDDWDPGMFRYRSAFSIPFYAVLVSAVVLLRDEAKNGILEVFILDIRSRAIVGSGKVGWVVVAIPSYAIVVSAVALLSLFYQYLTGNVDTGSSKAYSRSSLDLRDVYVAVVLFLGAYVWIKFREVAFKGVHERRRVDKQGRITKVVYEPRFKPPRENGTVFQWIYLGQYATPEEAAILYQIAAFYYNEGQGGSLDLEDGRWFSIPPMREEERSVTGADKRAWVKEQAMKVYEDFKKEKVEAALIRELLEACEGHATPNQAVGTFEASLLNPAEHRLPLLVSSAENSGMPIAMLDDEGFEYASQCFGGVHEGFVTSNGPSLGFQEESGIPFPQLPPSIQSGMGINNSNQLNLHPIVHNQQELITYQRQQIEERDAQISLLQQQLEESRIHIRHLDSQHFAWQQLQVTNHGVSSFEVEMEQSMPQQNHPCRPHGSAFW